MANNRIQIKRTSVTGRAANTTTLTQPGELALNMTDGIMYSTNGSVVFEIGANNINQRVSGTLTVNAVSANGGVGTNGQFLTSNGSTVYWSTPGTALNAQQNIFTYTLAANASVIQGADNAAQTLSYTAGLESVFINGSRQILGVDYATTNSTAITLVDPALTGEVVQIVTWAGQVNTTNVNAQFAWTNTHSFSNTVTFGAISANGSLGTAGQVLHSNGTATYWAADDNSGTVTSIATSNGISGGTITSTGTIGVTTGSTLTVNTTGIHVNSALSISSLALSGALSGVTTAAMGNTTIAGFVNTTSTGTFASTLQVGNNAGGVDATIHIKSVQGGNGRFLQFSPQGNSVNALALIASSNSSGGEQWWSFGSQNDGTFKIQAGVGFGGAGLSISNTGSITSANVADAVGYKGLPQNQQTSAYTLVMSDIGKHIYATAGSFGVTIPANSTTAFPIGAAITIVVEDASHTVVPAAGVTLILAGTGAGTTGTRTLALGAVATLLKVGTDRWYISGAGVT